MRQLLIWGALSCALLFLGCSEEDSPTLSPITDDPSTWPIIFSIDDISDFYVTDGGYPGPSYYEYYPNNGITVFYANVSITITQSPIWIHFNETLDFTNYDSAILEFDARTAYMANGDTLYIVATWNLGELGHNKIGNQTHEIIQYDLSFLCGWQQSVSIIIQIIQYSYNQVSTGWLELNLSDIVIRAR